MNITKNEYDRVKKELYIEKILNKIKTQYIFFMGDIIHHSENLSIDDTVQILDVMRHVKKLDYTEFNVVTSILKYYPELLSSITEYKKEIIDDKILMALLLAECVILYTKEKLGYVKSFPKNAKELTEELNVLKKEYITLGEPHYISSILDKYNF